MSLSSTAENNRKKFTGYERDSETGLDFAEARYNSSTLGRFTSPDPLYFQLAMLANPQEFNLYSYARNNPLKWTDPDGERVKVVPGSSMAEIYQMVGGKDTFDQFFRVEGGEIVALPGVDLSNANAGVKFLAELVNSPKTFLVYSGADADAVARLFDGTVNKKGELNSLGKKIRDQFRETGVVVGTSGRPGQNQPAGDSFMLIAINAETISNIQSGIGGYDFPDGFIDADEQFSGLGQKVQPVGFLIHELAENLDFSRHGSHPEFTAHIKSNKPMWGNYVRGYYDYRRSHNYAIHREAEIRRDLGITGGFAGGCLDNRPTGCR